VVFAGADSGDPSTGVVVLLDGPASEGRRVVLSGHGSLEIIGGTDMRLELLAADGSIVFFEVEQAAFD
jgi:hypothetical protein